MAVAFLKIGWRNVARRPGRLVTTALAFTLAMVAIVLIRGFSDGLYETYSGLVRNTPVELWVGGKGVKSTVNAFSLIPARLADPLAAVPGVQSVTGLYAVPVIAEIGGRNLPMMLNGFDRATGLGGPWRLSSGSLPASPEEIVLDQAVAERGGLGVGSAFTVLGREFRISGLARGTSSFMSALAFADRSEVGRLIQAPDQISFLLVRLQPGADPAAVRQAVGPEYEVYTPRQFVAASDETLDGVMGPPLRLLLGVSFLVGLAVIALSTYSGILERRHEYGVLRAVGMPAVGLFAVIATEVAASATLGIGLGAILAAAAATAIGAYLPAYAVVITAPGLGSTALMGLAMGLVAVVAPLWRLTRADPAEVFRV